MSVDKESKFLMEVTKLEDFLRKPPCDFAVEVRGKGYRLVKHDPECCCVFIDEIASTKGKVIFQNSPGREIEVKNLKDYMHFRRNLTSKRIFILTSACEDTVCFKTETNAKVLQQYIVAIDGSNPVIKWEIERGLDWAISSVAGESYIVDIDLGDVLQSWTGESFRILIDGRKVKPLWKDTCFTLKYSSDALFDFSHWFGCSKRHIKIRGR
ncbi:hypothetical protein AGOR_G00027110 [Albula goreensis]|uniref:Uncharacterized protein n=1 Tax=Albula goreensis TaxID=1534307 RepID=A0A8T3E225_9TELE|nr:hypothetical protein AGOR_G00027110 [Albula goreensis]